MCAKIVVANRIHRSVEDRLRAVGELELNRSPEPWSSVELQARCRDADALMAFMTERIDLNFLQQCSNLKVIAGALKGHNNFDLAACTAHGVSVTVVKDLLTEPTAELTIGLIIALLRQIGAGDRLLRDGEFRGWRPAFYGASLHGATVGLIGAGAVGKTVLRMLRGFDCERRYFDPHRMSADEETALGAAFAEQSTLIACADVLVLAIHLTSSNRHLVDRCFLESMKPGAFLINPARGSLVDESAVADALESGHLAGYAADTFESEDWQIADRPAEVDRRLLSSDATVLTPHIGSAVRSVREAIEHQAAHSLIQVLSGEMPEGIVNREVWRK